MNFHPVHSPSGTCFTPHPPSNQKEQCWLILGRRCSEHTTGLWQVPRSTVGGTTQGRSWFSLRTFCSLNHGKALVSPRIETLAGKTFEVSHSHALKVSCIKNVWLSDVHLCFSYMQQIENIKN